MRRRILLLLAAGAVLTLIPRPLAERPSPPAGEMTKRTAANAEPGETSSSSKDAADRRYPARPLEDRRRAGLWMLEDPALPVVVADYLVAARFPPHSRPLRIEMIDLIDPNRRNDTATPVRAADRSIPDPSLRVLLTGDKLRLLGAEPLYLRLLVTRDETPIAVTITRATARALGAVGRATVGPEVPLTFEDAGDGAQAATLSALGTALERHFGPILVAVEFDAGARSPGVATLEVHHQPADLSPGRFTGRFREELRDGSLVVLAGVEIREAGSYVFDANFFDRSGAPTAFARAKVDLLPGESEVPLTLFGRVVHEQHAHAPFSLRSLRGFLFLLGQDPDRRIIPDYPGEYRTSEHAAADFSEAEYWDPAKQARVDHLQALAKEGVGPTRLGRPLGEAKKLGWQAPVRDGS